MDKIESNAIIQIGVIVRNIEETAKNYAELFGLPMPKINTVRPQELSHATYRDLPTMTRARLTSFKMGAVGLELMEPDLEPSAWKELLERKGEGVQFLGLFVEDAAKTVEFLEGKGISLLQRGDTANGSYHMVDSVEKLGVALNVKDIRGKAQ